MSLDPLILSRIQFAWVIAWHILLPAFTVGAASYITVLEGLHLATGRAVYLRVSNFWIRIFAVAFGMGVVTGVVMPFQFGTAPEAHEGEDGVWASLLGHALLDLNGFPSDRHLHLVKLVRILDDLSNRGFKVSNRAGIHDHREADGDPQ